MVEIARRRPFEKKEIAAASTFCIGFLRDPLDAPSKKKLLSLRSDVDNFNVNGCEIYWLSRLGQGEATFSNNAFEKLIGVRTTLRGVNTIRRIASKYA